MAKRSQAMSTKVRKYLAKHPLAKAQVVADATGATVQYVHNIRYADKKNGVVSTPAVKKPKWKLASIVTSKKSIKADMEADAQFEKDQDKRRAQGWQGQHVGDKFMAVPVGFNGMTIHDVERALDKANEEIIAEKALAKLNKNIDKNIIATHHTDMVNHPPHYKMGGIETIDFIEAKQFGYNLGNVVKYISRADLKGSHYEDLLKARWYLNREIAKFSPDTKVTK
jgi:hypothetical protein